MVVRSPDNPDAFWDAEGRPKTIHEVLLSAQVDVRDPVLIRRARWYGVELNGVAARESVIRHFYGEGEIFRRVPGCEQRSDEFTQVLMLAVEQVGFVPRDHGVVERLAG